MSHEGKNGEIIFNTAYNIYLVSMLWIFALGFLAIIVLPKDIEGAELLILYIIMLPVTSIIFWILIDTKYVIKNGKLHYSSGPIRGHIDISAIRKIEYHDDFIKTNFLKPGLARKGFVIYYNKFDDIFISPKNREGFLDMILKINPEILVGRS